VQFAAVIGEPGLGRTSLTSTWCRNAADGGSSVVAGRCTPEAAVAYQPIIEIAHAVLGARSQLLLEAGAAAGNVEQLVPGIEAPKGLPIPIQTDLETTQYLMAEAFAALLCSGGRKEDSHPLQCLTTFTGRMNTRLRCWPTSPARMNSLHS
jgi:hypothetical protein